MGALVVDDEDEVLVIMERGKVVRSAVVEVPATGRTTQGVIFAKPDAQDRIIAVARNTERHLADDAGTVGAENAPGSDDQDMSGDPDAPRAADDTTADAGTTADTSPEDA